MMLEQKNPGYVWGRKLRSMIVFYLTTSGYEKHGQKLIFTYFSQRTMPKNASSNASFISHGEFVVIWKESCDYQCGQIGTLKIHDPL